MNRILTSDRCRMTPAHVDALMKISIEGPSIPNIRNATDEERMVLGLARQCVDYVGQETP